MTASVAQSGATSLSDRRVRALWRNPLFARVVGLAAGVACAWLASRGVDLHHMIATLWTADPRFVAAAILVALLNVPLKGLRWQLLIGRAAGYSLWQICRALVIGQLANLGLPLRVGDIARIFALGEGNGRSKVTLATTIVLERWLDALVLGCSLLALLPSFLLPTWVRTWTLVGPALVGLGILLAAFATRRTALARRARLVAAQHAPWLAGRLDQVEAGAQALADSQTIVVVWLLSVLTWGASVAINYFVAFAVGLSIPIVASAVVLLAVTIGGSIPSPPLRVGTFEYLCVLALAEFHVPLTAAVSYGLLLHLVAYGWPVLFGGTALLLPAGWSALSPTRSESR